MVDFNLNPNDKIYPYFVNGEWKYSSSGKLIKIYSPINNELVGSVQSISELEADEAIESASQSVIFWKDTPINKRAELLKKAAKNIEEEVDRLTYILCFEIGKPYSESKEEVLRTVDLINFYAEEGLRISNEVLYSDSFPGYSSNKIAITKRVPLGVVLAISPFNYPINEGAPKIAGALVAGNTVVFKPSTQGAISALSMIECFRKAGFPNGVINTLTGQSSIVGDYLIKDRRLNAINFTGSTQTANHIQSIMNRVPFIAGLGGKDAAIVLKDADLENAVVQIAKGAFSYSGQRCTAIKRVIVMDDIKDRFSSKLIEYVNKSYTLSNPLEKDSTQGPVINFETVERLDLLIEDALCKGAKLLLGGFNKDYDNRLYYKATILSNVTEDMNIAWEEPFGPVLPIISVKSIEEAILIVNKSVYGLQSSIFTQDIDLAFKIAESLEVGTVQINGKDSRGPDNFPFNGIKDSGIGNVQGAKYLIESMTRIRTIVINKK